jgi:hypothetical protein
MPQNSSHEPVVSSVREPRKGPFQNGSLVVVTLGNPREKFWGMILSLAPEGLGISGIELASFEDLTVMAKEGEPFSPMVAFFPMHRIERMELDLPDGNLPSLSQRFSARTGLEASAVFASHITNARTPGHEQTDEEPA